VKQIVTVGRKNEGSQARVGDGDAQFLVQFADQARLRRLSGLDLAARKFPQAGQLFALRPPADQHPPVGVDQRAGRDKNDGLGQDR